MQGLDDFKRITKNFPFKGDGSPTEVEWWAQRGVDFKDLQEFCAGNGEVMLLVIPQAKAKTGADVITTLSSSLAATLEMGILIGTMLAEEREVNEPKV